MFDLREVQRALLLAGLGTAIVIGLFSMLIKAHQISNEAHITEASIAKFERAPVEGR